MAAFLYWDRTDTLAISTPPQSINARAPIAELVDVNIAPTALCLLEDHALGWRETRSRTPH
jgi:hypothetical protein